MLSSSPPWVTSQDFAHMRDALTSIIASWARPLLWIQAIGEDTPGAVTASDFDAAVRSQILTTNGPSFGRGWQLATGTGTHQGYLPPVGFVGGIWVDTTIEVVAPEGIVLYTGAVLVYQGPPVRKFDIIVDPTDTSIDPAGTRYAVGDELVNNAAFGQSIYRYAALEQRQAGDRLYAVPLS